MSDCRYCADELEDLCFKCQDLGDVKELTKQLKASKAEVERLNRVCKNQEDAIMHEEFKLKENQAEVVRLRKVLQDVLHAANLINAREVTRRGLKLQTPSEER